MDNDRPASPLERRPLKRVRKGTKSCTECRHRKIRCDWSSEDAANCQQCLARGRKCEVQTRELKTADAVRSTPRARIAELEFQVRCLSRAVRRLNGKVGIEEGAEDNDDRLPRLAPVEGGGSRRSPDGDDDDNDALDEDDEASESPPTDPPPHLMQLFSNSVLGADGNMSPGRTPSTTAARHGFHTQRKAQLTSLLQTFMPSREDMQSIATIANTWLKVYDALFPMIKTLKTSEEMMASYDRLQQEPSPVSASGDWNPVLSCAALLLSIAITVLQTPAEKSERCVRSIPDTVAFVKQVSDVVERTIIADDALAGSLEGIEVTLLWLRLQLGRAKIKKMYIVLRRIIAFAEFNGLPRASKAMESRRTGAVSGTVDREVWHRAEVWESICAIDRIMSMMWAMPLGTPNSPLPKRKILDDNGQVVPQSYLYYLADIASRIMELDGMYTAGRSGQELFNTVLGVDQELRLLASQVPPSWWRQEWSTLNGAAILQYWHYYLTVRAHLQLALREDQSQQFAFNFVTGLEASRELAKRYVALRCLFPSGFFAIRVIDLQAFTAAVFLLLASHRSTTETAGTTTVTSTSQQHQQQHPNLDVMTSRDLAQAVVDSMERAANMSAGATADFGRQAATAIRSLATLLQHPQTPGHAPQQKATLHLPLVGNIHVARKPRGNGSQTQSMPPFPPQYPGQQQQHDQQQHQYEQNPQLLNEELRRPPATTAMPDFAPKQQLHQSVPDYSFDTTLSYSMEIPDDFYTFLNDDETLMNEQWLTWS